jgi:transcriptional antiterminator NusG
MSEEKKEVLKQSQELNEEVKAQDEGAVAVTSSESLESAEALQEGKFQEDSNELKKWYVVHTLSGHEQKVKNNLLKRIETMNMKDKIFNVLIPTEEEVEIKNGKKRIVQRKIFPGYVLVEMIMSDDSWYVVRNTAGVTGFVGSGTKPLPLPDEEAKQLLKQSSGEAPRRRLTLKTGDKVRITSGPFVEFYGAIQEVNPEKEKIKVLVSIFGRETPVELDYGQVEKL